MTKLLLSLMLIPSLSSPCLASLIIEGSITEPVGFSGTTLTILFAPLSDPVLDFVDNGDGLSDLIVRFADGKSFTAEGDFYFVGASGGPPHDGSTASSFAPSEFVIAEGLSGAIRAVGVYDATGSGSLTPEDTTFGSLAFANQSSGDTIAFRFTNYFVGATTNPQKLTDTGFWGTVTVDPGDEFTVAAIPEPSTFVLSLLAGLGLSVGCRRRR